MLVNKYKIDTSLESKDSSSKEDKARVVETLRDLKGLKIERYAIIKLVSLEDK